MSSVVTLMTAGKLRALAVATAQRSSALPEVPTADEAGVAGYVSPNAGGVLAPAKTPRAIVSRLNTEIVRILETKEIRERFDGSLSCALFGVQDPITCLIKMLQEALIICPLSSALHDRQVKLLSH